MNIKPKTGVRNYAKGGAVDSGDPLDDPNQYVQGSVGGFSPGDIGGVPGGPPGGGGITNSRPHNSGEHQSGMTQSEWLSMTPDKLYPGSGYARAWKKLSPNG